MTREHIYLAAPYPAREQVRAIADTLRVHGHVGTSTWIDEAHEINPGTSGAAAALTDAQVAQHAQTDLAEIRQSSVFVALTAAYLGIDPSASGGCRHVELGYALGFEIPAFVVGEPENVFHRIGDDVELVARLAEV